MVALPRSRARARCIRHALEQQNQSHQRRASSSVHPLQLDDAGDVPGPAPRSRLLRLDNGSPNQPQRIVKLSPLSRIQLPDYNGSLRDPVPHPQPQPLPQPLPQPRLMPLKREPTTQLELDVKLSPIPRVDIVIPTTPKLRRTGPPKSPALARPDLYLEHPWTEDLAAPTVPAELADVARMEEVALVARLDPVAENRVSQDEILAWITDKHDRLRGVSSSTVQKLLDGLVIAGNLRKLKLEDWHRVFQHLVGRTPFDQPTPSEDPTRAIRALGQMKKNGVEPDPFIYMCLLRAHKDDIRRVEEIRRFLVKTHTDAPEGSASPFSDKLVRTLIAIYLKRARKPLHLTLARNLWDALGSLGVTPSVTTCKGFLEAFYSFTSSVPQDPQGVSNVHSKMKFNADNRTLDGAANLAAMAAHAACKNHKAVLKILDLMREQKMPITLSGYKNALYSYREMNLPRSVTYTFVEMSEVVGLEPDDHCYEHLLWAYARMWKEESIAKVHHLVRKVVTPHSESTAPNGPVTIRTYARVCEAYSNVDDWKRALRTYYELKDLLETRGSVAITAGSAVHPPDVDQDAGQLSKAEKVSSSTEELLETNGSSATAAGSPTVPSDVDQEAGQLLKADEGSPSTKDLLENNASSATAAGSAAISPDVDQETGQLSKADEQSPCASPNPIHVPPPRQERARDTLPSRALLRHVLSAMARTDRIQEARDFMLSEALDPTRLQRYWTRIVAGEDKLRREGLERMEREVAASAEVVAKAYGERKVHIRADYQELQSRLEVSRKRLRREGQAPATFTVGFEGPLKVAYEGFAEAWRQTVETKWPEDRHAEKLMELEAFLNDMRKEEAKRTVQAIEKLGLKAEQKADLWESV
ncbi:hypothetical protein HKX48_002358 [Thoreauomyces humboldtii]|nr:hypothetical protein HKX48_002358 [Thoreauomyces humboldtii]